MTTAIQPKKASPVEQLGTIGACPDAVEFVRQGKFGSLQSAWDECERGDWMLWYAGRLSGKPGSASRRKLVLAAGECTREVLPIHDKRYPNDKRERECIETAGIWDRLISMAESSTSAALFTSHFIQCQFSPSGLFQNESAAAARKTILKLCADIVRKHYPKIPIEP